MNIDKLKDQCQFCKHFDIGHIDFCSIYGECLYNFDNHNRPIGNTSRWELHPDIAEAVQPETTELNCNCICNGDNAWDTLSVIAKLVEATDILLHKKDYDGHGWEEMEICYKRGLEILRTSAPPAGGE